MLVLRTGLALAAVQCRCEENASCSHGGQPLQIELTMARRALAGELGMISKTFSRTLARFREQKLIAVKGRTIIMLSLGRLREMLQRNLGEQPKQEMGPGVRLC